MKGFIVCMNDNTKKVMDDRVTSTNKLEWLSGQLGDKTWKVKGFFIFFKSLLISCFWFKIEKNSQ
jgi:hypothetical protein